jgi:hypothetical protein
MGPRLGTPPIRMPPLTPEKVDAIKSWAMSGAKYQ